MDKNKIKLVVASEMIIIAHETKGKKPSDLTFEEMVDVVTDIVFGDRLKEKIEKQKTK